MAAVDLNMLILALVFVIFGLLMWPRRKSNKNEPPVVYRCLPLIGHAYRLLGNNIHLWNTLKKLYYDCQKLGGVVTCYLGTKTVYVLTDPEDFLTVSNTCLQKDTFYDLLKPWLGEGLLTCTVPRWKTHRRLLNPAFNQKVIDGFLDVFNKQARRLVEDMGPEIGKELDPWIYTRNNNLETICSTAFGVDFSENTLNYNEYAMAIEQMLEIMVERIRKLWYHSDFIFRLVSMKKKHDASLKILHNMSNTIIQKRKADFKIGNVAKEEMEGHKFKPFMDLLLELADDKGVFSDLEVRENVDTIVFGGHDTASNVLAYTMLMVGSHPNIQDKIFEELVDVFGDDDRDVTKHDLSQLLYLEAVLKETMRLFPIVPIIARRIESDVKLREYTLSKGSSCFLSVYGVHRHPMWGPDAEEFKPERWLTPETLPKLPAAFSVFGAGKRICIGKLYAYMSMKATLAHFFRVYKVKGDYKQLKLKYDVILRPVSGHYITIEKRKLQKLF